ncbi:hypothetical protein [Streptomyces sp. NPDC052535]|uniref:hypothetical protein n=1 Tax=Streptomyces sp. NPDC052535 TaxID=3155531 RepID=UPI0034470D63
MARDLTSEVARLRQEIKEIKRGQRYAHGGSIENNALEVRDGDGSLRAIVGVQSDGTTGLNVVNGPPPPVPSAPILGSVLGGITVSWNGQFAGGVVPPLDWQRVEVHASTIDGFTPALETLKTTFETPQGGTVVVPCEEPVYVLLVARNTSGTASTPTVQAGPLGPAPVVATDILDGIVTTLKLADDAVTTAKLAAGAVDTVALADNAVLDTKLADNAVKVGKIADNAVTGPAISSDAVTAGKIAADAVTAREIAAGSVTAAEIAAGAVTAEKLTIIGGSNLLSDPSFEGAYTAAQLAGLAYASQDTTMGNGSPTSIKIDCAASTPSTFQVPVTNVPVLPGDQLYLAVDYWVSTDWNGGDINFQVRWEDAAGTRLTFGKAVTSSPVRETWTRMSATLPAPANAANAKIRLESAGTTLGTVRFDNAAVRPVVGGVQIADGAISTPKLVAGAVQALQIDAGAVNADKIAAGAVTTAKLDALAVTADKIAANAITAGKIVAGAVDATALAADAITGKTITGGTINGAVIQTAETGERITLNEADANKILVYNTTEAIGELSARGLLVKGTGGAVMWLDPSAVLPQIRFDNASGTNSAFFQMAEVNPGDANIQFYTGAFTADGFTDRVWRQYMGADFTMIERIRRSSSSTWRGGRINLRPEFAEIGYMDSASTANAGYTQYQAGAISSKGRHLVEPQAASVDSALHVTAQSGHTGNLLRLFRDGEKLSVDKDGNTVIAGMLTAGNIVTGTTTITPSAAHTPTSALVSFPALKGTTFRGYATAATTVPGVRTPVGAQGVTGVSMSSVTSSNALVWVNRENTTATIVNWMVIAS